MTWGHLLADQLDFYMDAHLLPRLDGLDDDEYLWRPRPDSAALVRDGDGWVAQTPAERVGVPTIGWRMHHITLCIHIRSSTFFGDGSLPGVDMFDPRHQPAVMGTADAAVTQLAQAHRTWRDQVRGMSDETLLEPLGPLGAFFADDPMAALALHVNREVMHHGGETGLLRDLYATRA